MNPSHKKHKNIKEISYKDKIDYYLILDFEATCYNENETHTKLSCQEIIEFPVLVIDINKNEIISKFHYYIKPTIHQELSSFCIDLTGISQEMVNEGILLDDALDRFDSFLIEKNIQNFMILTCGDWDLKTCIRLESQFKHIKLHDYFNKWVNIKTVFESFTKEKAYDMVNMLKYFKMNLDGRHHSGIDDCYNLSKIVMYMINQKADFLNKVRIFNDILN